MVIVTPSAGASLNEPPPELQQLALNFLPTFFSRHLTEQQPSYICTRPDFSHSGDADKIWYTVSLINLL